MKKLIIIPLLLLSLSLTAPTLDWWTRLDNKYDKLQHYEELLYQRELDKYAHHLAYKESHNNWKVINDYGYMGAFQHGTAILSDFGLDITPEAFRADSSIFPPDLQYRVIMAQIKAHTIRLRRFDAWIGHKSVELLSHVQGCLQVVIWEDMVLLRHLSGVMELLTGLMLMAQVSVII